MSKHHDPVCCMHGHEPGPRRNAAGNRLITIARLFDSSSDDKRRTVPMIRLRGRWLAELGFTADARIAVSEEQGRLVLTVATEE
jgi:hypothetical protein